MKFARIVFRVAGILRAAGAGAAVFSRGKDRTRHAAAHYAPEFFYGFICVAVAWQVLFLMLSTDPSRYRPMMIPAMLEKIGFPIAVAVLYLQGRVAPTIFIPALARSSPARFVYCSRTGRQPRQTHLGAELQRLRFLRLRNLERSLETLFRFASSSLLQQQLAFKPIQLSFVITLAIVDSPSSWLRPTKRMPRRFD